MYHIINNNLKPREVQVNRIKAMKSIFFKKEAVANISEAMEVRNHSINGANSKSQMSRGNFDMNRLIKFGFLLLAMAVLLGSCEVEELLPPVDEEGLTDDVHNIIPDEILEKIKELGTEINGGNKPPNIEGAYLISPLALVKSNFSDVATGTVYWINNGVMNLEFLEQNNTKLTVKVDHSIGNNEIAGGLGAFITGEGNKFSVYVEAIGTTGGYQTKSIEVHSGEITPDGIKNYQWTLIMVDAAPTTIKSGQGRLWKDKDGLSERVLAAPSGKFIVVQQGTTLGTYNNSLEAVYQSSKTGKNISQVRNDQGQVIYEQNSNPMTYWKFQGEKYIDKTTSVTDARSWLGYGEKAYVFKSDGTVYGVRAANASNNKKGTNDKDYYITTDEKGLIELDGSYVYKRSVSRSDLSKMTATLDLRETATITNAGKEYQENLYIYGYLGWAGWEFIEIGFVGSKNNWKLYKSRKGGERETIFEPYNKPLPANLVNLEWRIEGNSFNLYVNGGNSPFHSEYIPESWVRNNSPFFMMATTMCPEYKNDNNKDNKRITNFRDGAFLGPVKWLDCKLYLTGGSVFNFWREDSHNSIYCNDHTVQVLPPNSSQNPTNSEIITLSRTGSFTPQN